MFMKGNLFSKLTRIILSEDVTQSTVLFFAKATLRHSNQGLKEARASYRYEIQN